MKELIDTFGRRQETLRISVTDRCQMRCQYCLPSGLSSLLPHSEILTFEEIAMVVRAAAGLGIRRVRLTGGEPLLRRNLDELVRMIRAIPGISTLALTTNGLLLSNCIDRLEEAGLTDVSISLDSVDARAFRSFTGSTEMETVKAAIRRAARSGRLRVELNAVSVRDRTEREIGPLLSFARDLGVVVRFIELMPFENIEWSRDLVLPGEEVARLIGKATGAEFEGMDRSRPGAPARRFRFTDGRGGFGLIEPVTRPFCDSCDRLRLRSDGMLLNCLFCQEGPDLKKALRGGREEDLPSLFRQSVREKGPGGMIELRDKGRIPTRIMASVGG